MRLLDLFSGIGGFSIGLERAGMRTVAFCEIDPYCQRVLAKHWPRVPCYGDIRTLTAARLAADGIIRADRNTDNQDEPGGTIDAEAGQWLPQYAGIDAICGGFPCQDISVSGKGAGIGGERSGLWQEYWRLVGELRPRIVIVENVTALLHRGLSTVLGDLAALGYDAEWHCIPASAVGAPHRRDRVWIVAYPQERTERAGLCAGEQTEQRRRRSSNGSCASLANAGCEPRQLPSTRRLATIEVPQRNTWWRVEPDVGRVAHGIPARVDRLRALGNAVVPQIPELIGRAIMQETLVNRA